MEKTLNFMKRACLLCDKSTCGYKTGCVIVKDLNVLVEAWNETLPGESFCQNGACYRQERGLSGGKEIEKVCSIHAESGAVAIAASKGISIKGAKVYVTTFPCLICARLLVKSEISTLYYMSDYMGGNEGLALFSANNIELVKINEDEVWNRENG